MRNCNFIITVPADAPAPYNAGLLAATVMTKTLHTFSIKLLYLSVIWNQPFCSDYVIENNRSNLVNFREISSTKCQDISQDFMTILYDVISSVKMYYTFLRAGETLKNMHTSLLLEIYLMIA